ncbi:MAG: glycosyltransferase [Victivallales bacterium]|nr:glycosyltransferase [Victivallales bacterium]
MPTLSLITICRNSSGTLARTLDSVASQSVRPKEYIFVDGGSQDGTLELLASRLPDLREQGIDARVVSQGEHPGEAGIPHAWNLGLGLCHGEVIGLLNSDDWYDDGVLEAVVQAFDGNSEVGGVSVPVQLWSPEGAKSSILRPGPLSALSWKMAVPHPGCFFRRRVYEGLGKYDTRYKIAADYDFIWRCRQAKVVWQYLSSPAVNMQAGGLANSSRAPARRETLQIARKYIPWSPVPFLAYFARLLLGK